jgi:hypothetical protein
MHTKFWPDELQVRGHLEDKDRYNDNIKMDLKDIQWLLTGFIWLRTE